MVPYTTGCKFAIAELPEGVAADKLFDKGQPSVKCASAIREIHSRFDVEIDQLLDEAEFNVLLQEIGGKALVCH